MGERVVRLFDYERRSREPDATPEARDPAGATIIALPAREPVELPCDVEPKAPLSPWAVPLLILALVIAFWTPARAQGTVPGQFVVPLGSCQLTASQLGSAIGLASCTRASFTGSAGSPNASQLVVTSVTGIIELGDTVVGTGITTGTTVVSQVSGTIGGAGTYLLSATNTASSASLTAGGIPAGATMALLQAETADVRFRDDGGAPTASIGSIVVHGTPPILYTGTVSALQFIALSGSPLLDVSFYR